MSNAKREEAPCKKGKIRGKFDAIKLDYMYRNILSLRVSLYDEN